MERTGRRWGSAAPRGCRRRPGTLAAPRCCGWATAATARCCRPAGCSSARCRLKASAQLASSTQIPRTTAEGPGMPLTTEQPKSVTCQTARSHSKHSQFAVVGGTCCHRRCDVVSGGRAIGQWLRGRTQPHWRRKQRLCHQPLLRGAHQALHHCSGWTLIPFDCCDL